jgi:hypothetical protein
LEKQLQHQTFFIYSPIDGKFGKITVFVIILWSLMTITLTMTQ